MGTLSNTTPSTEHGGQFVPVKSVHNHDTQIAEFGFHPAKKNFTAGTSFSHTCFHMPKDAQASSSLKNFKTRAFKFFKDQSQICQ